MHLDDESLNMAALLALAQGAVLDKSEATRLVEDGFATWNGPLLTLTKQGRTLTKALKSKV